MHFSQRRDLRGFWNHFGRIFGLFWEGFGQQNRKSGFQNRPQKKGRQKVMRAVREDTRHHKTGGGCPIQGLEGRPDKGWRDKGQGLRIDFDPMDTPLVLRGTVADMFVCISVSDVV